MIHYERIDETKGPMKRVAGIKAHDLSLNLFGYAIGVSYCFKHGSPKLADGSRLLDNERKLKLYYRRPNMVFFYTIQRVGYWKVKTNTRHLWKAYKGYMPLIPTRGRLGYGRLGYL